MSCFMLMVCVSVFSLLATLASKLQLRRTLSNFLHWGVEGLGFEGPLKNEEEFIASHP